MEADEVIKVPHREVGQTVIPIVRPVGERFMFEGIGELIVVSQTSCKHCAVRDLGCGSNKVHEVVGHCSRGYCGDGDVAFMAVERAALIKLVGADMVNDDE